MKKYFQFGSPKFTAALFLLACALLLGSSVGGARAALTYYSETYRSKVQMYDIGVTLKENGADVSNRDYQSNSNGVWDDNTGELLKDRWSEGNPLQIGMAYDEALSVTNSGTIDQYVRVNLYKYWVDQNGKKQPNLDPDLIQLNLVNLNSDWEVDTGASTPERTVLYYKRILPVGATSAALTDKLTISTDVINQKQYDGAKFQIEAEVDAVQTHNAEDAIWSAWGRRVSINNGSLSL